MMSPLKQVAGKALLYGDRAGINRHSASAIIAIETSQGVVRNAGLRRDARDDEQVGLVCPIVAARLARTAGSSSIASSPAPARRWMSITA